MLDWKGAFAAHPFARRINLQFDPGSLESALRDMKEDWWKPHLGPYHDGGWEVISLWAPGGNLFEQRSFGAPYGKTVAALVSPHFGTVMERFPAEKSRVRLMRLKAGGNILRHSDPLQEIATDLVRFHIPITTNPDVHFIVNDRRITMVPGEVWHIDVRFPHEVHNRGGQHRVHLVLDLLVNSAIHSLLQDAESLGSDRLTGYYLKHCLPKPVRKFLNIGN